MLLFFYFPSIELIETEVEGTKAFLEFLHQEPDLILHCQEIEAFCNNLLPKEDDPTETAVEAQTQEESHSIIYLSIYLFYKFAT